MVEVAVMRKTGFFDIFPGYFKVAVGSMCAVIVFGACGLAAYQLGLATPAAEIVPDPVAYEGLQTVDGPIEGKPAQGEKKPEQSGVKRTAPAFEAGSYTVTAPSGLNVRYEAGIDAAKTGGKFWGGGVKVTKTKLVGGNTWGRLAGGGWIAMEYDGETYVTSDKEVR